MKTLWSRLDRSIGGLSRLCGWGAVVATLAVAALLMSNVVLRVVAQPIYGVVDLTKYAMLVIVMLALPYTHREHAHIVIRLVTDRFPPRGRHCLELLAQLLTAGTTAYIAYLYLARTLVGAESFTGGLIRLPEMPFRVLIVVGFGLWAVEALVGAAKAGAALAGRGPELWSDDAVDHGEPPAADGDVQPGTDTDVGPRAADPRTDGSDRGEGGRA